MTREQASELARGTAEALGTPDCVCRQIANREEHRSFSAEALIDFQGPWSLPEYEIVELWRPDGRQVIATD